MFVDYKFLPITIKVSTIVLSHDVDYKAIMYFLKHQRLVNEVIALRDEKGNSRGYGCGNGFKNCTTIDVWLEGVNQIANIKLFKNKILVSSIRNHIMAIDATHILLKAIKDLKKLFQMHLADETNWQLFKESKFSEIKNSDLLSWYTLLCYDYISYAYDAEKNWLGVEKIHEIIEKLFQKIDPEITSEDLTITHIESSNVNNNFNLYTKISKIRLAKAFNGLKGYKVIYRNDVNNCVNIIIEYTLDEDYVKYIKRKNSQVIITIYSKGSVTLSGPHQLINEKCYNKFIKDFQEAYKEVKIDKPYKVHTKSNNLDITRIENEYNIIKNDPFGLNYIALKTKSD